MILGSLLLIVVAIGLLVLGLIQGANLLLVASIAASLLAAVALIVGGRQSAVTLGEAATQRQGVGRGDRRGGTIDRVDARANARKNRAASFTDLGSQHEDLALAADQGQRARRAERESIGAGVAPPASLYGTRRGVPSTAQPPLDRQSDGGAGLAGAGLGDADETSVTSAIRDDASGVSIPQQGDRLRGAPQQGVPSHDDHFAGAGHDNRVGTDVDQGFDGSLDEIGDDADDINDTDDTDDTDDESDDTDDESDEPMDFDDEDPADEPVAQQTSPGDAARVAALPAEVMVIDGRPRYHLRGCVHLLGRASEPLPVSEAVELAFTPCGICEPDTTLLAGRRG